MGRIPTTVGLVPGTGLVARFGNVVIFLHGESPSTERILGAAETAATAADPGVAIAQRLAATVFSSGSAQPPAFGLIAPTADGILVLLRGPVAAAVDGPEGSRKLSGARALTWADEIVRDPVRRIGVIADGASGEIAHTDLRSGIVLGGGFVVHAPVSGLVTPKASQAAAKAADPAPAPEPTRRAPTPTPSHTRFSGPIAAEPAPAQPVSPTPPEPEPAHPRNAATTPAPGSRLGGDAGSERAARPLDKPVRIEAQADPGPGTRATPAEPAEARAHGPREAGPDLAKKPAPGPDSSPAGGRADRPDPDDQPPTAAYIPGVEGFDSAVNPAVGTPPPATSTLAAAGGALASPEGAVYPLDRPYVIGRDPMIDEAVRRAVASPIVIARDRHVSRVHARVFIENGLVYVRDAGTPGGTFVAAPGAADWVRVGQRPMELKVGWSLRIGERILTYRTS
ncbi:FHA domain-containing protein [Nocardia sp. CDC153]|uniref:FHA domain-containing protein n=1 Tax=Nocardia sp. CDC153 TaxID=3112167 RepID=UPI002DBF3777|nr:FHA domain-containing protein [Nocardia sp. CDC153]MEC3957213.1 FHA domain-containing protein [Nocardia sp. CDC153]